MTVLSPSQPIPVPPPLHAPDALVDRAPEARRLIQAILAADRRILVFHGAQATGKTELMTHWVIPGLRETPGPDGPYEVVYGDCAAGLPRELAGTEGPVPFDQVVERPVVIVLDNFENILELPRDERRGALDRLFELLHAAAARATTVLVTDSRQLTGVYSLTSYDRDLGGAVLEIAPVDLGEGLRALSREAPETAVTYTPAALEKLSRDAEELEEKGWNVTFSLIKQVDQHCRALGQQTGTKEIAESDADLAEILRSGLEEQLARLEAGRPGARRIAEVMLERLATPRAEVGEDAFAGVGARLGVSDQEVRSTLKALTVPDGLLLETHEHRFQLIPPQLGHVLEQRCANQREQLASVYRMVTEGFRSSRELGTLLPAARFDEIHQVRQHLLLDQEGIRFLLQCALRVDGGTSAEPAGYWLGRISDPSERVLILLGALGDKAPATRARAAELLGNFRQSEVRGRLHRLALEDPDPDVRAGAISSLDPNDDELMQLLLEEAKDDGNPQQSEAIEALRIFRRPELPPVLRALVHRPVALTLRVAAIRTLSHLEMPESVDALLGIALTDPDPEDECAATTALGAVQSPELNRHVLDRLGLPGGRANEYLLGFLGGSAALACAFVLARLMLNGAVSPGLIVWGLVLIVPTGVLLRRVASRRLEPTAPLGLLGLAGLLFCSLTILFLVHGLAHASISRWRRALVLLGAGVLGIVCGYAGMVAMPLARPVGAFYLLAFVVLFAGSYLADVVGTFFETALARRIDVERRTRAVYERIIGNPVVARLLFDALHGADAFEVARARAILTRFGSLAPCEQLVDLLMRADGATLPLVVRALARSKTDRTAEALEERWRAEPPTMWPRIAQVLYLRPTQASLQALGRVRKQMSVPLRLRSVWAAWQFRVGVWPWYARVAMYLLVPAVGLIGYHGVQVMHNRAWSTILMLKAPGGWPLKQVSQAQRIKTVAYLADVHPEDSRAALLEEFESGKEGRTDPLGAAIADGLLIIYSKHTSKHTSKDAAADSALREELVGSVDTFAQALRADDAERFGRSLHVLGSMGAARDPKLAGDAAQALVVFVRTGRPSHEREAMVLDTLANLPYDRALPSLDATAADTTNEQLLDAVRQRMDRVVDSAYARVVRDSTADRSRLLAILLAIKLPQRPPLVDRTIRELQEWQSHGCDRNGDRRCGSDDAALEEIENAPSAERGYRSLFDEYLLARQYARADTEFRRLKAHYPSSIWPRKVLSELYHEYMAPTDSSAFMASYDEMIAMRRLDTYEAARSDTNDFNRIEADFAEVALSARRYADMRSAAERLQGPLDAVYRLNLTLFDYIHYAVVRDRRGAEGALNRLEIVVDSLPPNFYNGWIYPGTVAFIKLNRLPARLEQALLSLCRERQWYTRYDARRMIAENRQALRLLQ